MTASAASDTSAEATPWHDGATLMPQPSGRFYPPDEVAARLDELKRVVAGKEGPYIRGESDRSRPYGHAPSRSRSRESRGDLPNLRALSDDASAHGSDDTSADSEEFYQVPWPANLEVLQVLGEGASGQVAKVRLRSTGQVLARKVRCWPHTGNCVIAGSGRTPPAPARAEYEPRVPK